MITPSHNFWDFSLNFYSFEDVANSCLELQQEFDLDVNLLLFCLWFSKNHGEIDDELFEDVWKFSYEWKKEVVQALRNVRKWMKVNSDSLTTEHREQLANLREKLRERIKREELEAERFQQLTIEKMVIEKLAIKNTKGGYSSSTGTKDGTEVLETNLLKLFSIHSIDQRIWKGRGLTTVVDALAKYSSQS